ncbi:MAG: DUF2461 domain-containing protein [Acidimicrobiales bacterium]|nr:DUF2461 domain-containing protein [Acidimicrobiales bacterium]
MGARFTGWPAEALAFYAGLEADNSKAYFTAHRAVYHESVREPMLALAESVAEEFGPLHLFRPNRDVRFSTDTSPYKTQQGAVTEGEGGSIYYVAISAEGLFVGTGYHQMASDQLQRFRRAVADDTTGPELVGAVEAVERRGCSVGGEALKTAPRGWPKDHPRVRFLRHKGLTIGRTFAPAPWLHTARARDRIVRVWRDGAATNAWLDAHVGPSTIPPDDRR